MGRHRAEGARQPGGQRHQGVVPQGKHQVEYRPQRQGQLLPQGVQAVGPQGPQLGDEPGQQRLQGAGPQGGQQPCQVLERQYHAVQQGLAVNGPGRLHARHQVLPYGKQQGQGRAHHVVHGVGHQAAQPGEGIAQHRDGGSRRPAHDGCKSRRKTVHHPGQELGGDVPPQGGQGVVPQGQGGGAHRLPHRQGGGAELLPGGGPGRDGRGVVGAQILPEAGPQRPQGVQRQLPYAHRLFGLFGLAFGGAALFARTARGLFGGLLFVYAEHYRYLRRARAGIFGEYGYYVFCRLIHNICP